MKSPPLSMTTLAKIARVHVSTVSRALRGEPTIPEATRLRIKDLAAKLGYRPDPALAALCAYRKLHAVRRYQATLAIIATSPYWRENLANELYFEGARQRAEELGYKTEVFVLAPPRMPGARIATILAARNIRGVLFLPLSDVGIPIAFPWEDFSVVAIGYKLNKPNLNRISVSHFDAMQDALARIQNMGYKKPGLVLRKENSRLAPTGTTHVGQIWEGGYRAEVQRRFPKVNIPVLQLGSAAALRQWIERHSPDVVITQERDIERFLAPRHSGIPRVYTMVDGDERLTGIHQNSGYVGRQAVDTLIGALYRHETAAPPVPITLLVQTRWQDGTTARKAAGSQSTEA